MKKILLAAVAAVFISGCAGTNKYIRSVPVQGYDDYQIALTGDVMMGRRMQKLLDEKGYDFPFNNVRQILKNHQVSFTNLESPLIYSDRKNTLEKIAEKQVYLYSDEKASLGLKNAGINIVSLANNHILDYGQNGLTQTVEILENYNIDYCGIRNGNLGDPNLPCIKEINGAQVAFLCYSQVSHKKFAAGREDYGTIPATLPVIKRDIKNIRDKVDIIIVYLHWGKEKFPVKDGQYIMARKIIDEGADMIFGSHTHMFQDVEKYKDKYILYGLGNFIFDQDIEENRYSAIVSVAIKDKRISKIRLTPVYSKEYITYLMNDKEMIIDFLSRIKLHNISVSDIYDLNLQ